MLLQNVLLRRLSLIVWFRLITDKMTSASEQACYTLINTPTDSEPPSEMQLKQDLGMYLFYTLKHELGEM